MNIPLARPWFDEADERAVVETLRSGWVGSGPTVARFERQFADFVAAPHAAAVSSCTTALHLAAVAAGFGPGDEVLVPALTWISTPNAIELTGARPVFCDIDPVTLNIDVARAKQHVTPKTRGIVPVHLFGLAADMDAVMVLAREHDLFVIEDAACALGTRIGDAYAGTIGDVGCFSFHPRKSITTGEGGMLVQRSAELDASFRSLRDIGADRAHQSAASVKQQLLPDFTELGYNYRLTDLQAALGLSQLAKFPAILEGRLDCARRYAQMLARDEFASWLATPSMPTASEHSFQAYVCRLTPPDDAPATLDLWHRRRNELMQRLSERGIATRPGTHAPHALGYYRDKYAIRPEDCPNAWNATRLTLALPLYHGLVPAQQQEVCAALADIWPRTTGA